ncbi:MAG: hypothetical protein LBM08_14145 [Dysgonamonadaceae bacterium]|nr:hypothetical protein [Dysgonamonadaceae bacterium]
MQSNKPNTQTSQPSPKSQKSPEKDLIIGIDPDLERSGVAIWIASGKIFDLRNLSFWQLFDFMRAHADRIRVVRVEAGWLNKKSNFHSRAGQTKTEGEAIARNVGENHAIAKIICQMCVYLQLQYEEVQQKAHKLDRDTFRVITGYKGRTNQETRDAAMLVYGMNLNNK